MKNPPATLTNLNKLEQKYIIGKGIFTNNWWNINYIQGNFNELYTGKLITQINLVNWLNKNNNNSNASSLLITKVLFSENCWLEF